MPLLVSTASAADFTVLFIEVYDNPSEVNQFSVQNTLPVEKLFANILQHMMLQSERLGEVVSKLKVVRGNPEQRDDV